MSSQLQSNSEDEDHRNKLKPSSNANTNWLAVVLSWLKWRERKHNVHGGKRSQSLQLAGAAFATALMAAAYRYRHTHRGNKSKYKLLLSTILGIVSTQLKQHQQRRKSKGLSHRSASEAPISVLWTEAKLGRVQRALISADSIAYQIRGQGQWKRSLLPSANIHSALMDTLAKHGCTDVAAMPESIWSKLATPALAALPFVYLFFVYRMMRHMSGSDDKAKTHDSIDTKTTFADVAGIDAAVREVSEIVVYLKRPEVYANVGAHAPRGVLLYGPPGSGKTLLARAVAGEANCGCFLACSGSDFVDTYVGRGASRVRKLFEQARREARNQRTNWVSTQQKPSAIIFIDEIDALAKARSSSAHMSNDERDQTLNQLLTCMDGFRQDDGATIIVIAATNRPDILDPALLRRMDRKVEVGLPNQLGRQAILKVHARHISCNVKEIDWSYLAIQTDNLSGAELRTVTNEAALLAVRQRGDEVKQHHFIQAVQKVQQMKGALRGASPLHHGMVLR